jgi:MFS family permease
MAIALVNTALFLGAAVLQPLFGWIMDLTWDGTVVNGLRHYAWGDYRNALGMSFGVALLGLAGALLMRETHNRNVTLHRAAAAMP